MLSSGRRKNRETSAVIGPTGNWNGPESHKRRPGRKAEEEGSNMGAVPAKPLNKVLRNAEGGDGGRKPVTKENSIDCP